MAKTLLNSHNIHTENILVIRIKVCLYMFCPQQFHNRFYNLNSRFYSHLWQIAWPHWSIYQRKATVQDRMCKIGSPFLVAKLFSRAHLQSLPLNKCISRQVGRHTANIHIVKNTTLYCVLTSKTFLAFSHRCTACAMNVQVYNGFTALTLYFDLSYLQCMQSEYVS